VDTTPLRIETKPPTGDTLRVERVPATADLDAARPLPGTRPDRITRHCELPCDVAAAGQARAFVDSVCADWAVTGRILDATLITSELVTNAVTHARTASMLVLGLDQHGLHVAVRDECTQGANAIRTGRARQGDGRGLHLVAELSRAWGVAPHPDGKTVWAVLGR